MSLQSLPVSGALPVTGRSRAKSTETADGSSPSIAALRLVLPRPLLRLLLETRPNRLGRYDAARYDAALDVMTQGRGVPPCWTCLDPCGRRLVRLSAGWFAEHFDGQACCRRRRPPFAALPFENCQGRAGRDRTALPRRRRHAGCR